MKKYWLLLIILFHFHTFVKAQSFSPNDTIISAIKNISGFTPSDSIQFVKINYFTDLQPFDSIDFNRIIATIENQKPFISKDVYLALNYLIFKAMFNHFGKTNKNEAINFGLHLVEKIETPENETQHELLIQSLAGIRYPFRTGNRIYEGIKYFSGLAWHYQQANDSDVASICNYVLAGFYRTMGLFERAVYYQEKSIAFLNKREIRAKYPFLYPLGISFVGISGLINRKTVLGQMYCNHNEPAKALPLLQEAISLFNGLKNPLLFGDATFIFLQAARVQSLLQSDSVDYFFLLSEKHIDDTNFPIYRVHFLQEKGASFLLRNTLDSANFYLVKCIQLRDSLEIPVNSGPGNLIPEYYLAQVKIKERAFKEAIALLKKGIVAVTLAGQRGELLKEYTLIAQACKLSNDFEEAAKYYELENELEKKLKEEGDSCRTISFEIEQSINQKEIDTVKLTRENERSRKNIVLLIILSIFIIVVALGLLSRYRLMRKIEIEKMRSRLSRDLHDDIGSTLSSINILSRTAQINLNNTGDEKTKLSLEKINERSQRLLDNMSDIIWNINPGNDTIEEVISRMIEYATTMLEAKNIDYVFNFPKEKMDCKLNMEVKNNMYLIFKEAVNNLSKYSGCTIANLSLTFDEKNIHMKIEDNGKGFESSPLLGRGVGGEVRTGNGLNNMQHRSEEIKGVIKINSVIGKGTEIELTMPRYC